MAFPESCGREGGGGERGRRRGGKKGAAPAPFPWCAGQQHSPFVAVRAVPLKREKGREERK